MSASKTTTDHDTIRKWAEGRDGHPARVKGASDGGLLRIDFGKPEQRLEEISWEDFFRIFVEIKRALLYQDRTAEGKVSRFFKFIDRD